ncbi:MAG: prepilin peptidase [Candidatus Micrarchaeia archaeon]|jgi:prepilin signal peptidase PulO-like enzyme (type II secretory pathway)
MNFELLRIAVALAGTGAAAWQDAKTSFIDDKIVYGMIAVGLALDALSFDAEFFFYSAGVAAAILVVGFAAYKSGQIGGGDVLLFAAIQLLLPAYPQSFLSLLPPELAASARLASSAQALPFFATVLVLSSFFATIGSAMLYAWKLRGKKLEPQPTAALASIALAVIVLYLFNFVLQAGVIENAFVACLLAAAAFLSTFKAQIMREVIIKRVPISGIEDEDVLAIEEISPAIVKKYKLGRVLTAKEVAKLKLVKKEKRMNRFPVYKNLPRFGPYVFGGLIASLLLGDFIFLLVA